MSQVKTTTIKLRDLLSRKYTRMGFEAYDAGKQFYEAIDEFDRNHYNGIDSQWFYERGFWLAHYIKTVMKKNIPLSVDGRVNYNAILALNRALRDGYVR